jgi:hypothetical protein
MARPVPRRNRSKNANKQSNLNKKSRFVLPWPYVIFILMCVGVLLAGWTFRAGADNLNVTAKVSAPLPSGPAEITSPGDGTRFTSVPITVAGTCPADTYVQIYRNDFYSGTAICSTDGNFQLQTDLFPGANQLKVKVFNLTDDEGPQSSPITVYYDVPQQPTGNNGSTEQQPSAGTSSPFPEPSSNIPFTIKTNFAYRGYKVGQEIEWTLHTDGGVPPYALNIEWGDGTNSVISQKTAGDISVKHRYKGAGSGTKNSFTVKVTGSDSLGRQTFLQIFLVVMPSRIPAIVANNLPAGPHINSHWLLVAWPAYAVTLMMAASFWLGEKEEVIYLKKKGLWRRKRTG